MSTLEAGVFHDRESAKSHPLEQVISTACPVWSSFNGTTMAVRDDFNAASYDDNGAGDYDVNFTNNMNDGNYTCWNDGIQDGTDTIYDARHSHPTATRLTTSVNFDCENSSGTNTDYAGVDVTVIGVPA